MTTEPDKPTPWRDLPEMVALAETMTLGTTLKSWRLCEAW
jgi:hypothetical protein